VCSDYVSPGELDLRIQKIGPHYRVFERRGFGQWKTNTGSAVLTEVEVSEKHKLWADECSKFFGCV